MADIQIIDKEYVSPGATRPDASIPSMQALVNENISKYATGDIVNLLRFYTLFNGGGSLIEWDADEDKANHNGVTVIDPSHTTAPGNPGWWTSENTGTGCWKRVLDGKITVKMAGAKADWDGSTGYDNLPAFDATLQAAASSENRQIEIPAGEYFLDGTWSITKDVRITGATGSQRVPRTNLVFPANTTGIEIVNATEAAGDEDTQGGVLEYFGLECSSQDTTGYGIHQKCRTVVRHIYINGFAEHGYFIDGTSENTNTFFCEYVRSENNGKHGVFVDGGDANAGLGMMIDCNHNGLFGIYDSSFLGNTWIGCHTNGNGNGTDVGGAYKNDSSSAHCMFFGCYAEQNQAEISITVTSLFIAGETADVPCNGAGTYYVGRGFKTPLRFDFDPWDLLVVGYDPNDKENIIAARHKDDNGVFGFWVRWDGENYRVETNQKIIQHYLTLSNTTTYGRTEAPSVGSFIPNLWIGHDENQARQIDIDRAKPDGGGSTLDAGPHAQGDLAFYRSHVKGHPVGWACITQGTPGTWEPFGQVGHRENAGSPVGAVIPYFVGEELLDTTNTIWYKSTGATNSDWVALNS